MPESDNKDKKLFYRIREVAEIVNVTSSLLRFWEKDFECLQQLKKNKKGDRLYTEKNIEDLKVIFHLVKEKGYTLQGANAYMNKSDRDLSNQQSAIKSLLKIKGFLETLKESL